MKSYYERILAAQTVGDAESTIVEELIGALAKGAAGKAGGDAAGWILQDVGIDTVGDKEGLKQIEDELAAQTKILKSIQAGISKLEQEIKTAVNEIEDAIARSEYNSAVRILNSDVAKIQGFQERLKVKTALSPDPANRADVKLLRNDILTNTPTALAAIYDSMMGVAGAEGVYSLWARLSFKHSDTLSTNATKVYQQFMYYYTMQVNALQLMLEAYHSADPPETAEAKKYYTYWKAKIDAQLVEYRKNAARTSIDHVISVDGPVLDLAITNDHVYVYTKGWIHSFKTTDWSTDGSLNTGTSKCDLFFLRNSGDNLLLVASHSEPFPHAYKVLKVGTAGGLTILGQTIVKSVKGSHGIIMVADIVADADSLYLLTSEINTEQYKIQVVDLATVTLKPERQFIYTDGNIIEGLAVVGTTAIMNMWHLKNGALLTTVDLTNGQILAKLPCPKSGTAGGKGEIGKTPICVTDGVAIFSNGEVYVWVADVSNPKQPKLLQSANFGFYLHSLDTASNMSYFSDLQGGLHCIYRSQYQEALSMPWDIGSKITALRVADDYLYVGSSASGKVWVIGFTYPIANPQDPPD